MTGKRWYVYQNLNDASDKLVLSEDMAVAAIYSLVGGPFDSKAEAEAFARSG
jgi:hypothetical protein